MWQITLCFMTQHYIVFLCWFLLQRQWSHFRMCFSSHFGMCCECLLNSVMSHFGLHVINWIQCYHLHIIFPLLFVLWYYSSDTTFTLTTILFLLPHYIAKFIHGCRVVIVAIAIIILIEIPALLFPLLVLDLCPNEFSFISYDLMFLHHHAFSPWVFLSVHKESTIMRPFVLLSFLHGCHLKLTWHFNVVSWITSSPVIVW